MTSTELASASKIMLGTTQAVAMYIGSTQIWPSGQSQQHDYSLDYFTIESSEDNNLIVMSHGGTVTPTLSYSTDDGSTWSSVTLTSSAHNIATINTGDKIIIKGNNNTLANAWNGFNKIKPSKNFKVYGNAMSLLYGDNFANNSEFASGTSFNLCGLFYEVTTLIDAENLILPASTCTISCYNGMFRGCTNLTVAPKLPATQSAKDCYSSMFEACINLEVAPEINLVNMSETCCKRMFLMDRSSKITTPKMTKSPILRVATAASNCYEEMFKGNGNLVEITCLITNDVTCTTNWVLNACATNGIFRKSPLKTNWTSGGSNTFPSTWTVVDYVES